jgi:hypothetical protein
MRVDPALHRPDLHICRSHLDLHAEGTGGAKEFLWFDACDAPITPCGVVKRW